MVSDRDAIGGYVEDYDPADDEAVYRPQNGPGSGPVLAFLPTGLDYLDALDACLVEIERPIYWQICREFRATQTIDQARESACREEAFRREDAADDRRPRLHLVRGGRGDAAAP